MADGVGFIKIERQDPAKAFTMEDVARLLPNHGDYSQEAIDRFVAAHTGPIKDIFERRVEKRTAFNWPFAYNKDTETFDVDGLEEEFWKMVGKQPGKERHGGFQLAVMARLGKKWAEVMYSIIKASLLMRYTPARFRPGTRIPIPKSTPGETRPLTLLHDAYCFISSAIGESRQRPW